MIYRQVFKPILFSMDPERAKDAAEFILSVPLIWKTFIPFSNHKELATQLTANLSMPSPVGAAAGVDKNARFLDTLLNVGFGFAVGGTFTKEARGGNERPRMERVISENALLNSLGFPNKGSEECAFNMRNFAEKAERILSSVSGETDDDIMECVERFAPLSSAIELNISSPNTEGIKVFQDPNRLTQIVKAITDANRSPLFVKMPPWEDSPQQTKEHLHLSEVAVTAGAAGVVVANTRPINTPKLKAGKGGLSGAPLFESTKRMVRETAERLGKNAAVIACGGISDAKDVWTLLGLGATAVELYTAMVYQGPFVAMRINRDLVQLMRIAGISRVSDIEGEPPEIA